MRKVLVYIEPHPVRNYYEEFYDVGLILCDSMHQLDKSEGYDFRFISNDFVIDRLITERPALSYLSLRLTAQENSVLDSFYGQWNLKTINEWLALVKGESHITDFYVSVLDRVRVEYEFDAILLWSDNGAVRRFGQTNSIPVIHAEFGPTRSPFHKTVYFDPNGTNGAAAVLNAPIDELIPKILVPRETWVTRQGKTWNDEKSIGLIDAPLTLQTELIENGYQSSPYIFIPLQLEDDLNTQLYSKFKTPESFLKHIIPQALKAGLDVVIKGHPAAHGRTFNLIAETKALKYAKTMGDRVKILPSNTSAFHSMNMMAQAVGVFTINSSVGFESLLMGKNTFLYGLAAFDVGGKLNAEGSTIDQKLLTSPDYNHLDKLTSFLCNHYLHPLESVTNGNAIATVLNYLFETHGADTSTKQYWDGWMNAIDFGYQWLSESSSPEDKINYRSVGKLAGNRTIFESGSRKFFREGTNLVVTALSAGEAVSARSVNIENSFIGFIDTLIPDEEEGKYLQVSGWCLDRMGFRPPLQILFCSENNVVSLHRVLTPRRDVAEELGKNIALRCGFTFQIEKKHFENLEKCSLIFIASSNFTHIAKLKLGSIQNEEAKEKSANSDQNLSRSAV